MVAGFRVEDLGVGVSGVGTAHLFSKMRASEYMPSVPSAQMFGEMKMWSTHPRMVSVSVKNSGGG